MSNHMKANPSAMRIALEMVEAMKTAGIMFVPVPVFNNAEVKQKLKEVLNILEKKDGSEECATNHSPDIAKMVAPEGWQLVPVEPTPEMRLAGVAAQAEKLKRYALGGSLPPIDHGIPDAYQAMLAAAPKHEGGAS